MRKRPVRPFGPIDLAVLLAFAAGGASAAVWKDGLHEPFDRRDPGSPESASRPDWVWALESPAARIQGDLTAFLLVATLGAGTAALRRRGMLRRPGWPGPGIAAGTVGAIAVLYAIARPIAALNSSSPWAMQAYRRRPSSWIFDLASIAVPGAILGAWILLAVARAWRPVAGDKDDRIGRILGWGWLGLLAFLILYPGIWP